MRNQVFIKKLEFQDSYKIHNLLFNRSKNYINRDEYFKNILPILDRRDSVLLYGIPGNGKTQLAIEICYISLLYDKTVVWCDASSLAALVRSYTEFLSGINIKVNDSSPSRIIIKLSEWCNKNNDWLFVYDNYNSEGFREFESIEPLLPKSNNGSFLFTAVKKEILSDTEYIQVDCFTKNESYDYLSSSLKRKTSQAEIDRVIERLGCLPLALTQAASFLNRNKEVSIDEYMNLLDETSISFHKEKSGDNQHKRSLYSSIIMNVRNLLEESNLGRRASFLLFILSFFPESGISGYFLNRALYYPYRYAENNYDLDGKFVVPHLYSNSGAIAIDPLAQELFESYKFRLYDKKEFFQIIDVLLESGLCDVLYGNDTHYITGYFGKITWIKTHKLVQESIREYLLNTADMKIYLDGVIDILLKMFYFISSANKPFAYYGELLELVPTCSSITQNIEDSKINKEELDFALYRNSLIFMSTIEQIVSNRLIREYTNKKMTYDQIWRWDRILDFTAKNNPDELFLREFEYCSLFTPFRGRDNVEHIERAFQLLLVFYFSHNADITDIKNINDLYNVLVDILERGDKMEYRDYINTLLDDLYEAFVRMDRVKASGFGVVQILDNELVAEISKIYENNNIKVTKLGYRIEDGEEPKCLGFIPDNQGAVIVNRYSV